MLRTIEEAGDLRGKRVLMRVDFDVPVAEDGTILEKYRIERQKPMIEKLRDAGAELTLIAHISAVPSFKSLMPQLEQILGKVSLVENVRQDPGEEANDPDFARQLASGNDLFINNAFAVCHRDHASVIGVAKLLLSYAGDVVVEEVAQLAEAINAPAKGKVIVIGGAKTSTKLPLVQHLTDKAEYILVGGVVANEILDAGGAKSSNVQLPVDFGGGKDRFDIGIETAAHYSQLITAAHMVVWNGPMGMFEDSRYMAGTRAIARAAAQSPRSIIGGGDTIAALSQCKIPLSKFGFVSTGGGAMLAFLSGQQLPGLVALGY